MKSITELHNLIKSKEDPGIAKKLEEMSSKVEMLMRIQTESDEETEETKNYAELKAAESDDTKSKCDELGETELSEMKSAEIKVDEGKPDDIIKLDEIKLDETRSDETKLEETKPPEIKPSESDTTKDETGKFKKSRRRAKEQEIMEKIEGLVEEVNSIKEQINAKFLVQPTQEEAEETVNDKKEISDIVRGIIDKKESVSKSDILKIDLELVNVSAEVHKAMEKYAAMDKALSSDVNTLKEKNLIMGNTINGHNDDLEALKASWDEMVHNFESLKENIQSIEKELSVLTEFPGMKNRVEQPEGYVYSEYSDRPGEVLKPYLRSNLVIAEIERQTSEEEGGVMFFKPPEIEKARA